MIEDYLSMNGRLHNRIRELEAENKQQEQRIRELQQQVDGYEDTLDKILAELGVPTSDYPAPVTNAWKLAWIARHA